MRNLIKRYTHWLHTQWPAGRVEKLPRVNDDGTTTLPGVYIVGDLTGIPLLKFSADSGARAIRRILNDKKFQEQRSATPDIPDVAILGAGVSGNAAALEAKKHDLSYTLIEASQSFSTIRNFPKAKPIYTYPTEMTPVGEIQFTAEVKEPLLDELEESTRLIQTQQGMAESIEVARGGICSVRLATGESIQAHRVVVAIGRSGNFRTLDIPGESLDKVYNRLHDPKDFCEKKVLVVGGGDSALETAIALAQCGAEVSVSYRKASFSRPKPDNIARLESLQSDPMADVDLTSPSSERVTTASGTFLGEHRRAGSIRLYMQSKPLEILEDSVRLRDERGEEIQLENDVVFSMIGREAPLDFFRRSSIGILGETRGVEWLWLSLFFILIAFVYDWKGEGFFVSQFPFFSEPDVFPSNSMRLLSGLGEWWDSQLSDRSTLLGTLAISMKSRSFYYTLLYSMVIFIFGLQRIRRRKTPYVTVQTMVLMSVQWIPLFLLPELLLPWAGYNGLFDSGTSQSIADALFESYIPAHEYAAHQWPDWGHPRAYWRAYGIILAWPLMVYNVFSEQPYFWWLVISFFQTFVIIPLLIFRYGKGAYCGWICSCGALAETLGDTQRHKMPHGPGWNRLNMLGQFFLLLAFSLLAIRIWGWIVPDSIAARHFSLLLDGKGSNGVLSNPLSYKWVVDVLFGGVLGVGLYFKYSGRVWCRFACPLAALMHIYARFSRFRIVVDKKKCISCNQCTSVCHQGIDIMNFANKGVHMKDPQCVRCSACVQVCPTGVLQFGRLSKDGSVSGLDVLPSSPVLMAEKK